MTNQNNEKSKNGKRIALILLALLLIAAIAFGAYTYSKYVSSGNGSGSATVAQWGFTVNVGGNNEGFSTMYGTQGTAISEEASAVVKSTNKVVAPGTNGTAISFTLGGEAEVNAKIEASLDDIKDVSLTLNNGQNDIVYTPVKWTLSNDDDVNVTGTLKDIQAEIVNLNQEVKAGTTIIEKTYTLSWKWAFEASPFTTTGTYTVDGNALDTFLGQLATEEQPVAEFTDYKIEDTNKVEWTVKEYSIDIAFALNISITQINTVIS